MGRVQAWGPVWRVHTLGVVLLGRPRPRPVLAEVRCTGGAAPREGRSRPGEEGCGPVSRAEGRQSPLTHRPGGHSAKDVLT